MLVLAAALATVAGGSLCVTGSPPAEAASAPAISAGPAFTENGITIEPFYCTGDTTQSYQVPVGVTSLYVEAVGGQGQTPNPDQTGLGGLAGEVSGGLTVTPGQVFQVQVGCGGTSDGGASPYAAGGARGVGEARLTNFGTVYSFGYDGGGGGGASAVSSNGAEVAVAAGGGGAAGNAPDCLKSGSDRFFFYYCGPADGFENGGNGGDGASDNSADHNTEGSVGENNSDSPTSDGSECGAGDPGGAGSGFDSLGGGGAGGGGGGGYGGGCGGAAGQASNLDPSKDGVNRGSAGNGGGGGQSYAASQLRDSNIAVADNSGDGYVLFLTSTDGVRTTHFGASGHRETFCVPDGVNELFIDALGGAGGGGARNYSGSGNGGGGSGVQTVMEVDERTQLQIAVGEFGAGHGGWGDGHGGDRGDAGDGAANDGAGGGGSSAVRSSTTGCGEGTPQGLQPLVVAGGGGGGGGNGYASDGGDGGTGGTAANPNTDGGVGGPPQGGIGGTGGGARGLNGGEGTDNSTGGGGGGGGGGLNGGSEGHAGPDATDGSGGGGGGGQSYVSPAAPQAPHYYTGVSGDYGNRDGLNDGKVDLIVPVSSTRSGMQIVSGNNQSADPGQQFAEPLVFRYVDALSSAPVANRSIDLSFDSGSSAAATFPGGASTVQLVTDANGQVSVDVTSVSNRPASTFVVDAHLTDDTAQLTKSAEITLFNTLWSTNVALASSSPNNTSTDGASVSFQATVTSPQRSDVPVTDGTVQFTIDGAPFGTPTTLDDGGVAQSPPTATLAPGTHHVLATYTDGSTGLQASSFTSLGQTVTSTSATSVGITSSSPDAVQGSQAQYTATVDPAGALGIPTGTIQFTANGAPVGAPVALDGAGTAVSEPVTLDFPSSAIGGAQSETIGASYDGDHVFLAGTGTVQQSIRWASVLDIASSAPYGLYSDSDVVFTGTVEGAWYAPLYPAHTGTMQVFLGDQPLTEPVPMDDKVGVSPPVTAAQLGNGVHEITLRYSGDGNYGAATSDTFYQIVVDVSERPPGDTSSGPSSPGGGMVSGGLGSGGGSLASGGQAGSPAGGGSVPRLANTGQDDRAALALTTLLTMLGLIALGTSRVVSRRRGSAARRAVDRDE